MLATRAQAVELSIVFSQFLARRRHRPSQASVRSMTHLRGNTSQMSSDTQIYEIRRHRLLRGAPRQVMPLRGA